MPYVLPWLTFKAANTLFRIFSIEILAESLLAGVCCPDTSASVFRASFTCLHIISSHFHCLWREKKLLLLRMQRFFSAGLKDFHCCRLNPAALLGGGATAVVLEAAESHLHQSSSSSAPTWTPSHKERGFLPSGLFLLHGGNQTVEHAEGDETF